MQKTNKHLTQYLCSAFIVSNRFININNVFYISVQVQATCVQGNTSQSTEAEATTQQGKSTP